MTTIDISRLTVQERLDLIGQLCDSLEGEEPPLSDAMKAELDHRLATADEDIAHSVPWETLRQQLFPRPE
jgi:putative addiction module component (TIGR02574 family)